jgi:hypothetical protein
MQPAWQRNFASKWNSRLKSSVDVPYTFLPCPRTHSRSSSLTRSTTLTEPLLLVFILVFLMLLPITHCDAQICMHRVWVEPNPSSPRPTHDHISHPANSRSHGTHTRPTITVGTGRACLTTRSFGWSPTHPSLPSFLPTLRTSRTRCC